ncbi:MAG: polyhydroxyalkanoate synthesis repressor PhaR [Rhodospirillales bacterium]|nr:polyhydroxyalkanoate synthesis repressor PhaR [Rhodospirillales bacterium]
MSDSEEKASPVKIKKYANRRLYNTVTSSYVTLDHLCQMVKDGTDFIVNDAKTGEDITRSVLTQIIVEEEGKGGQNLLPVSFLRQLISFYGDNLQALVPRYLDQSMGWFARNQEQMRQYTQGAFGGLFPFGPQMEEMSKQNMAFFQNAMKMFSPFKFEDGAKSPGPADSNAVPSGPAAAPDGDANLDQLKNELEALQKRLNELSKKS